MDVDRAIGEAFAAIERERDESGLDRAVAMALVEVARAARDIPGLKSGAFPELAAALARLDGPR